VIAGTSHGPAHSPCLEVGATVSKPGFCLQPPTLIEIVSATVTISSFQLGHIRMLQLSCSISSYTTVVLRHVGAILAFDDGLQHSYALSAED
jgi:hypothetical protein